MINGIFIPILCMAKWGAENNKVLCPRSQLVERRSGFKTRWCDMSSCVRVFYFLYWRESILPFSSVSLSIIPVTSSEHDLKLLEKKISKIKQFMFPTVHCLNGMMKSHVTLSCLTQDYPFCCTSMTCVLPAHW
jgi:hypothetical protein